MFDYRKIIDHDNHLVRIRVSGIVTLADGELIVSEARSEASRLKYNILYDCRGMILHTRINDLYKTIRNLPVFKETQAFHTRTAILHAPEDDNTQYKFYEITATNFGLSVQVFVDETEAFNWVTAATEKE